MVMFPKSQVDKFKHTNKALRYGQQFYNFMKLEKVVDDKSFCDKLYNADETTAKAMIASRTDHNC